MPEGQEQNRINPELILRESAVAVGSTLGNAALDFIGVSDAAHVSERLSSPLTLSDGGAGVLIFAVHVFLPLGAKGLAYGSEGGAIPALVLGGIGAAIDIAAYAIGGLAGTAIERAVISGLSGVARGIETAIERRNERRGNY